MLHTKEFYEIMTDFEKNAKRFVNLGSMGIARENKENWVKQFYYCDGNANNAFKIYLKGVYSGRMIERL